MVRKSNNTIHCSFPELCFHSQAMRIVKFRLENKLLKYSIPEKKKVLFWIFTLIVPVIERSWCCHFSSCTPSCINIHKFPKKKTIWNKQIRGLEASSPWQFFFLFQSMSLSCSACVSLCASKKFKLEGLILFQICSVRSDRYARFICKGFVQILVCILCIYV